MTGLKIKAKLILVFAIVTFVASVFSVVSALAAQQAAVKGDVSITYYAPSIMAGMPTLETEKHIIFDYYNNQSANIVGYQETAIDVDYVGYAGGGISLFTNNETAYILSHREIVPGYNSCRSYFSGFTSLQSVTFNNFKTDEVTDMSDMFSNCSSIQYINLSNLKTNSEGVITTSMFDGCTSLTKVTLPSSTSFRLKNKAKNEEFAMFRNCKSLTEIENETKIDTSLLTSMRKMFYCCESIETLQGKFNTINVENFRYMFSGCKKLWTILYTEDWIVDGNVVYRALDYMFQGCEELIFIYVNGFINIKYLGEYDEETTAYLTCMFQGCKKLSYIYASEAWESEVDDNCFDGCELLAGWENGNPTFWYDSSKTSSKDYARFAPNGYFTLAE